MKFKVIDKQTTKEADVDAVAQETYDAGATNLFVMPGKSSWLLDPEGDLVVCDSCGNYSPVDWKRYEAVVE